MQGNTEDNPFSRYEPNRSFREKKMIPYWILAAARIFLTLLPQTGYIHPDEFFQSIEVVSGSYYDIDVFKPWEYNSTFPIRSAIFSHIIVGFPYSILNRISPYATYYLGVSLKVPFFLVIFPRLCMCLLSFVCDYCLYKICRICMQDYRSRLVVFASSYVTLVYATRTFSNSIELVLTSLLLYYVSWCMAYSEKVVLQGDHFSAKYDRAKSIVERVKYYKLRMSLPSHSLNHCFVLATLTVTGIFNRPTFLAFAFPPIFFWLQRGLGSRTVGFLDFHVRILIFTLCAVPVTVLFILADSFYFGYLTMAEIGRFEISMNSFVVTPLNFLKYNSQTANLQSHGLHPRFLHFLVNIPLLFNVLGVIGLYSFAKMIYSGFKGRWLELPRVQSISALMTASFVAPVSILSLFPHQEPRFLIPTIIPLVFLYTRSLNSMFESRKLEKVSKRSNISYRPQKIGFNKLQMIWYISNVLLTFFYGFVHQGAILQLTSHFAFELKAKPYLTHVHLFTSYSYPVPTALLHLRNTRRVYTSSDKHKYQLARDFYLYEEGSRNVEEVFNNIVVKIQECQQREKLKKVPFRLYYAFPRSFLSEFVEFSSRNDSYEIDYRIVKTFYPHVSTEKLPVIFDVQDYVNLHLESFGIQLVGGFVKRFREFAQQFGMVLLRIEFSKEAKSQSTVL